MAEHLIKLGIQGLAARLKVLPAGDHITRELQLGTPNNNLTHTHQVEQNCSQDKQQTHNPLKQVVSTRPSQQCVQLLQRVPEEQAPTPDSRSLQPVERFLLISVAFPLAHTQHLHIPLTSQSDAQQLTTGPTKAVLAYDGNDPVQFGEAGALRSQRVTEEHGWGWQKGDVCHISDENRLQPINTSLQPQMQQPMNVWPEPIQQPMNVWPEPIQQPMNVWLEPIQQPIDIWPDQQDQQPMNVWLEPIQQPMNIWPA
jgi:hypothetical protein